MSTHNIGFYEEISKIIPKLSSNMHLISSTALGHTETDLGHWFKVGEARDQTHNL